MTDILVHWLQRAITAATATGVGRGLSTGSRGVAGAAAGGALAGRLPAPLQKSPRKAEQVAELARSAGTGRCYSLLDGFNSPMVYQRLHPAVWRTASCASEATPIEQCTALRRRHACVPQILLDPPPVWFYCLNALVPSGAGKKSPGLIALQPGATLEMELDTRLGDGGDSSPTLRVHAKLQYLT
eukprot:1346675-Prymnesium_polylepis.3